MKQTIEKIKKYIMPIALILICVFLIIQCRTQVKYIKFYIRQVINTGESISFYVPFISKNVANDTLFTIAIGNNVLSDRHNKYGYSYLAREFGISSFWSL